MGRFDDVLVCLWFSRVINISSGKQKRCFSGSQTGDGGLVKVRSLIHGTNSAQ